MEKQRYFVNIDERFSFILVSNTGCDEKKCNDLETFFEKDKYGFLVLHNWLQSSCNSSNLPLDEDVEPLWSECGEFFFFKCIGLYTAHAARNMLFCVS